MPRTTTLLYLHGFLSSPQSHKAQVTADYVSRTGCVDHIIVPELEWGPCAAITQLHAIMREASGQHMVLMGSSLGGFYATHLSQHYGVPAALVNPATRPFDRWESYLGEHKNYYSDAIHTVTRTHIAELESLDVPVLSNPANFLLLVETGDETLDYRRAVNVYAGARQIVHQGGDHSYQHFTADLPAIFQFLLSRIP